LARIFRYSCFKTRGSQSSKRLLCNHTNHPKRPHSGEGRLWVSRAGAKQSIGANSKEELLQLIGGEWRQIQRDAKDADTKRISQGPQTGDRRARSQRKSRTQQSNTTQKSGFKKRGFKK
jgi:hypothetical protein